MSIFAMQCNIVEFLNRIMKISSTHILFIFSISLLLSCNSNKEDKPISVAPVTVDSTNYIEESGPKSYIPQINSEEEEERKIKNGSYTADVEYYNTTTGINTLYVTKVHVEDGYLKVIKWPNGVWLASEYFKPQKIRKDGTCIISNIEAGYENRVRILDLQYY